MKPVVLKNINQIREYITVALGMSLPVESWRLARYRGMTERVLQMAKDSGLVVSTDHEFNELSEKARAVAMRVFMSKSDAREQFIGRTGYKGRSLRGLGRSRSDMNILREIEGWCGVVPNELNGEFCGWKKA